MEAARNGVHESTEVDHNDEYVCYVAVESSHADEFECSVAVVSAHNDEFEEFESLVLMN